MTPFVIVPVKPLAEGKSRLAAVMTDAERVAFNRRLAERTLEIAIAAMGPDRTVAISRDEAVLELALRQRAIGIFDPRGTGLNAALDHAAAEAGRLGADAVLVLPVDLPLLTAADIEALIATAGGDRAVVVAPDRRDEGTNALLLAPPGVIPFAFGPDSLAAHLAAARDAGVKPVMVRRQALAFDIDTAEDFAALKETGLSLGTGWRDG